MSLTVLNFFSRYPAGGGSRLTYLAATVSKNAKLNRVNKKADLRYSFANQIHRR